MLKNSLGKTGYVGERRNFTTRTYVSVPTGNWFGMGELVKLESGVWTLYARLDCNDAISGLERVGAAISTDNNTGISGVLEDGKALSIFATDSEGVMGPILPATIDISVATSYYGKALALGSASSTITVYGYAIRIALK